MISRKINKLRTLTVGSDYDSGRHLGFKVLSQGEHWADTQSLDEFLSKNQIEGLEAVILATTQMYIEENEKSKL